MVKVRVRVWVRVYPNHNPNPKPNPKPNHKPPQTARAHRNTILGRGLLPYQRQESQTYPTKIYIAYRPTYGPLPGPLPVQHLVHFLVHFLVNFQVQKEQFRSIQYQLGDAVVIV